MKRAKGGFWCHVAGTIENDEKGWQTFIGESHEETQIIVSELYNAQQVEQFYEDNLNVIECIPVFVVQCPDNQEITINHEHTEYRWCSLSEAKALAPFPNQKATYEHIWQYFVLNAPSPYFKVKIGQ